jgi:wyosine [tRNA(Phe)-imidazoG37] synthetase (radical SAM superfamily)
LGDSSIVEELSSADWVSVKIDAADMEVWQQINRPSKELNFDSMLSGIFNFFRSYNGISCTETMLIEGVNDSESHLERLSGIIHDINPSKAYISIPTRPPAEKSVKAPSEETLILAWHMISRSGVNTELLTGFEGTSAGFTGNAYEDILNITAVHPLREDTLITLLEKDMADWQIVESLIIQRLIKSVSYEGKRYFLRQYNT